MSEEILNIKSSKTDVLNIENKGFEKGYPSFLGDDLGLNDNIHVTYQDIKDMHLLQRSKFWVETEIDLGKDRTDLLQADSNQRDVMLRNLITQWAMDSLASRSIIQTFGRFASNTEVQDLLMTQSFFESIHAAQYSEIIRVCYNNPTELMQSAFDDAQICYRTDILAKVFNELNQVGADYETGKLDKNNPKHLKKQQLALLRGLGALYGLEAISFIASFACTFALTRTGKFQGIDKSIGLIMRDELLHAEGVRLLLKAFKSEVGNDVYNEVKPELQKIFDAILEQEFNWSAYIFDEGRNVLGLDENILKRYVQFIAKPCFDYLGLEYKYEVIDKSPLPYMDRYFNPDMVQTANQEIENTAYNVASVDSRVDDILDF